MAESRALGDEEKALDAEADAPRPRGARPAAAHPEHAGGRRPRRRRRGRQRRAAHRGLRPGRLRRPPAGAPLGHRQPSSASSTSSGPPRSPARCSRCTGAGAPGCCGRMVQLSLDRNADAYEEIRPPTLVRTDTMVSTGHLPKFADEAYHIERDDLWAIPTAEVPLTSLHRDEVLDEADLPLRYTAYTSCFRREAGSAGRDTRGPAAGPRVRQGRAPRRRPGRRPGDRLPGGRARPQRGPPARPRPRLPGARPLHRRPRGVRRSHLGHRGLRARACDLWLEVSLGVVVRATTRPAGPSIRLRRRPAARAPRCATPSTARPWAGPARWPPTSRPTASPTARSPSCPPSRATWAAPPASVVAAAEGAGLPAHLTSGRRLAWLPACTPH